ncbi:MAG TPA: response regulator [Anaerolineales bacterium]|jgi:RNA polymerase sigma factor (sigma-70 family)|nr:response regulator [Anaerolineales bacterium]
MTAQALRALVVEDDPSWQQIINEILSDHGLEVDLAANLSDATIQLKSHLYRLAVVDLSLSPNDHNNEDGLRVLEAIRSLDPNCRAILLTGFATVELAVTALTDYGAFTFLRKESFHRSQFRDIVYRILVSPPNMPAQIAAAGSTSSPQANGTSRTPRDRALVVEDDAGWRNILEELLADSGFLVRACASFGEALGYLRKEKYALAVLDLSLQGMIHRLPESSPEGYRLLATTQRNNIPTIVVSGIAEPEAIQNVYSKYAISAYLEKQTFDRVAFRRLVKEAKQNREAQSELSKLTEREREVLDLLAQGLTNKEIAEKLVITTNTVKRHLKAIFEKLHVHTRSAATAKVSGE